MSDEMPARSSDDDFYPMMVSEGEEVSEEGMEGMVAGVTTSSSSAALPSTPTVPIGVAGTFGGVGSGQPELQLSYSAILGEDFNFGHLPQHQQHQQLQTTKHSQQGPGGGAEEMYHHPQLPPIANHDPLLYPVHTTATHHQHTQQPLQQQCQLQQQFDFDLSPSTIALPFTSSAIPDQPCGSHRALIHAYDPPMMSRATSMIDQGSQTSLQNSRTITGMIVARWKSAIRPAAQQVFPKKEDIAANSLIQLPTVDRPSVFWCSLFYYELGERVGEPFRCERFSLHSHPYRHRTTGFSAGNHLDEVQIDGLCAPSDGRRFCLGILSNVNRSPAILATRRQIGKGCRLYLLGEDVYLQCLSGSPIFVQCPLYASGNADNPATVYRLPPGLTIKLFDRPLFNRLLEQACAAPSAYNAVYALQPYCQARISFVKGWGVNYRRQTITSTPCWVEAQFTSPLQVLDKALLSVRAPDDEGVHSFT